MDECQSVHFDEHKVTRGQAYFTNLVHTCGAFKEAPGRHLEGAALQCTVLSLTLVSSAV
jgi:hypothetical protein